METNPTVTRKSWKRTIAAGGSAECAMRADYFFVHQLYTVSTSADVEIPMSVNDLTEADSAPVRVGEALNGTPGTAQIRKVKFFNNTGGDIYVEIIFGLGQRFTTSRAVVSGTVNIDPDDLADLAQQIIDGIASPVIMAPVGETVDDTGATFTLMKSIYVENTSESQDVVVTAPSGLNRTLAAGEFDEFSVENDYDYFEAITVTPASGGSAKVLGVRPATV